MGGGGGGGRRKGLTADPQQTHTKNFWLCFVTYLSTYNTQGFGGGRAFAPPPPHVGELTGFSLKDSGKSSFLLMLLRQGLRGGL